jgi:DNA-binding XRE family transcriptional regulator
MMVAHSGAATISLPISVYDGSYTAAWRADAGQLVVWRRSAADRLEGSVMVKLVYENEQQKTEMEEAITPENCGVKLRLIRQVSGLAQRELAKVLGCSETTIFRLETGKTVATEDFINRLRALNAIGHHKFAKMSEAEKEAISEALGTVGGVATGIAGSIAAVSAAGSVAGLSATGVTSGLAALGCGLGMVGGLAVVAAIPAAVGLAGFGLVKGIKAICEANNLSCKEVNGRWEIVQKAAEDAQGT